MEQLTVLGTGNAMATKYYNTCFTLTKDTQTVLVDAGGGNGILVQMQKAGQSFADVRHLIVTHEHCDHLLGVVWVVRKIGTMMLGGDYPGELHIWCHEALTETIKTLARLTLQKKISDLLGTRMILHGVSDGTRAELLGWKTTFFDIHSTKAMQYGFTMELDSGKKLTCLGDEPYNPLCRDYVAGTDILLCEAFCLYDHRDKFHPYEKHHSTVKEACALARELDIPMLVLWHTEDKTFPHRQELYTAEGSAYYTGKLLVPNDLDVIGL